jgi:hypothetical protein
LKLRHPAIIFARRISNFIGSFLTLVSLALPWSFIGNYGPYPPHTYSAFEVGSSNPQAEIAPWLIVFGGTVSLFSNLGALFTIVGLLLFTGSGPVLNNVPACPSTGCILPTAQAEMGYWLAWAGATISLIGRLWTPPPWLTKKFRVNVGRLP